MLRKIFANDGATDQLLVTLSVCGYWPEKGCRILDLGCGEGRMVAALRAHGMDAYGFDLNDYVAPDIPIDRQYFRFANEDLRNLSDTRFDPDSYRLPFDDESFDLVVSTAMLEHLIHLDPVVREIARVTVPEGASLHVYPSINALIEPHIHVPLATRIQSWWYFYVWALLGVRNEFQGDLAPAEVASANQRYSREGLKYRTRAELKAICKPYFRRIEFVGRKYNHGHSTMRPATALRRTFRRRLRSLGSKQTLKDLVDTQFMDAVLLSEKQP